MDPQVQKNLSLMQIAIKYKRILLLGFIFFIYLQLAWDYFLFIKLLIKSQ